MPVKLLILLAVFPKGFTAMSQGSYYFTANKNASGHFNLEVAYN